MDLKNSSLNSSENTKGRNSSVPRKKAEISAATIINSLERDIADLIQDAALRTQKNKLISLNGNFKILKKFLKIQKLLNYFPRRLIYQVLMLA